MGSSAAQTSFMITGIGTFSVYALTLWVILIFFRARLLNLSLQSVSSGDPSRFFSQYRSFCTVFFWIGVTITVRSVLFWAFLLVLVLRLEQFGVEAGIHSSNEIRRLAVAK
mmetsp:Transcript_32553/g.64569  ORF Transcript_32553/g.64569 Transcript_32553/m.64569 type:complete len:111 (-) Transcript_32553:111-443(-)